LLVTQFEFACAFALSCGLAVRLAMLRLLTTLSMVASAWAGCMHTGKTLHLTELNWKEEVEYSGKLLHVIEFSSPWCRWSGTHTCDDMEEAWEILGEEYNNSAQVQIAEVDCSRWPGADEDGYSIRSLCQIHEIQEYPTVRAFSPAFGLHGHNYTGASAFEPLRDYVETKLAEVCKLVGDELQPDAACSKQDEQYAATWKLKSKSDVDGELNRLRSHFNKAVNDKIQLNNHFAWMGRRINLLNQIVQVAGEGSKDEL